MNDKLNFKDEFEKAQKWVSDTMFDTSSKSSYTESPSKVNQTTISYSEVVRELISQIDNGCDLIPIDSSFSYEDLMTWVKKHRKGNKVIIINDSLKHTTGQVLAVVFAQDNKLLLSHEMPKVCFIYKILN
jgi:hypothetical protein